MIHPISMSIMTLCFLPIMKNVFARRESPIHQRRKLHAILGSLVFFLGAVGMTAVYAHKKQRANHVEHGNKITWKFVHKISGYTVLGLLVMQTLTGVGKYFKFKFLCPNFFFRSHKTFGEILVLSSYGVLLTSIFFWKKYGNFKIYFLIVFMVSLVLTILPRRRRTCREPRTGNLLAEC